MFVYSKVRSIQEINDGVYAALFFLSHYTIVYVNAALNPAVLIFRSADLRNFAMFEARRILTALSCGRVEASSPRTRRESLMANSSRRLSTTRVSVTQIPQNFRPQNRSVSSPSGSASSSRYTPFIRHQSSADILQITPKKGDSLVKLNSSNSSNST